MICVHRPLKKIQTKENVTIQFNDKTIELIINVVNAYNVCESNAWQNIKERGIKAIARYVNWSDERLYNASITQFMRWYIFKLIGVFISYWYVWTLLQKSIIIIYILIKRAVKISKYLFWNLKLKLS